MVNIEPVKSGAYISAVADLAKIIWTEHYTPIIGSGQVSYMLEKFQSVKAIHDQVERGIAYYLMQFQDNFVGYFSFSIEDDVLFLSKLYVLKSARGNGVARAALSFIQEKGQELGLKKIKLTVNKNNSNSIVAYQKMGFVNVASIVQDIGNGYVMDDYVLEKAMI